MKWVYPFGEGTGEMRELLGGKGAGLAEMTSILGPERVPGGFVVTTEACVAYLDAGQVEPPDLGEQVDEALAELEGRAGKRLGDPDDPLLLSVRSGARVSMPGMMDTVLNLGLNDETVEGLGRSTGDERFAWDAYRRFVQMFGNVVRGVDSIRFQEVLDSARTRAGAARDTDLSAEDLRRVAREFAHVVAVDAGRPVPDDPREQLTQSIRAVFDSWNGDRARSYRRIEGIPDTWGTAVNVQLMVFGNRGARSGSGVAFSRDERTGEPTPSGDFLLNAQGEDVVSGVRDPEDLDALVRDFPGAHAQLLEDLRRLEAHFGDMQDVEFTIEEDTLYLLQTRSAKRPAQAAVRFAFDAVGEGLLAREQALMTIDADKLDALLHPSFDPSAEVTPVTTGVAASPGAATGAIVLDAQSAVRRAADGEDVILVRRFTEADDVAGFHAARGILTAEGGKASHAALVARGMGRPCVAGASDVHIDVQERTVRVGDAELREGDPISIDGSTGIVTLDSVPLVEPEISEEFEQVLAWADELRRLGVRANADTAEDAARARRLGAEGIGLCRTEHMFFGADRTDLVRQMFIAAERRRRAGLAPEGDQAPRHQDAVREFVSALEALGELQRADFVAILHEMRGRPVCVRLLDPPLHEFLPLDQFEAELEELESGGDEAAAEEARHAVEIVRELQEANPMLGTRGIRLGVLFPQIYEMQVRAVIAAAAEAARAGDSPHIEIMLPLIAYEAELVQLRESVTRVADQARAEAGPAASVPYSIGTMIELPRACLIADRIADHADFFSFGTNDLTQTTIGLSRDDVEGSFLPTYLERGIVDRSPFETIDTPGVGALVELGVHRGRDRRPDLVCGICGEHGGDPESIGFFESCGIDYVSCSPYRVPIARVAAAQAAIRLRDGGGPADAA